MQGLSPSSLANLQKLEDRGRDGPVQKEVLIAWDIENARLPAGVPVEEVEKAVSNAFQYLQRRKRVGFMCAVSPSSHDIMMRVYGRDQMNYLMQHTEYLLAPGGTKSGSTDSKLLERMEGFVGRQIQDGKAATSVLVVITGDDDYTKCIRQAMNSGMDVEVLHPRGITSANLLSAIRGRANAWHHEWQEFLQYWLLKHQGTRIPPDGFSATAAAGGNSGQQQQHRQPRQQLQQQQQQQQQQQHGYNMQKVINTSSVSKGATGSNATARTPANGARAGNAGTGAASGFGFDSAFSETLNQTGADSSPGGSSGGGGGNHNVRNWRGGSPPGRVSATLSLISLKGVQDSKSPGTTLALLSTWLLQQRRDNSEFYQRLQATASEWGCKLVVGNDMQSVAELTVTCVDADEPNPQRVVQNVRDEVRRAINNAMKLLPVLEPVFAPTGHGTTTPPPPPPPPPRPHQYSPPPQSSFDSSSSSWNPGGSARLVPVNQATAVQLQLFIEDRGLGHVILLESQHRSVVLSAVNAALTAATAMDLPNAALRDGCVLATVPGVHFGTANMRVEKEAAGALLSRALSIRQLKAALEQRGDAAAAGDEKGELGKRLASKVLEPYWAAAGD